eukprot:TRINITY_DN2510_c5_g1_i1.p1 TRINITY_DN2510_c5_g1~~TRINITY_DN2510_c5_g1_i1.p1  ORF type:complete len:287 (+),score=89.44 TRINITY_DN2510_c5_g1_i1:63-863(+)
MKLFFALLVVFLLSAEGAMECSDQCTPWTWAEPGGVSKACDAGNHMDYRLMIGDTQGGVTTPQDGQDYGPYTEAVPYKTYFFCPKVDEFTAFDANGSLADFRETKNVKLYASVFGAGKSSEVRFPEVDQDASVMVWDGNNTNCPGSGAVATFLIFNMTMKDGNYRYKNADPIGTGFVNTCSSSGDSCAFDGSAFCIGENGRYNCATCNATGSDVKILMSFYGTDSSSKNLLSGSSNPLNFREFALGNVYSDLQGDVNGISWPSNPI